MHKETKSIIFGLGTNLGNKKENLEKALSCLQKEIGKLVQVSSIYLTKAKDFDGNDFYNITAHFLSNYSPEKILLIINEIERRMGRKNKSVNKQYQNRIIDIDILYYENIILNNKNLIIPHPEIQNRNFVLYPLLEILPKFFHPKLKKSHQELLTLSPDKTTPKIINIALNNPLEIPFNYIAIEGNIGAGKTTFVKKFANDFNAKPVLERFEENAFLPKFYEDPKRYAFPLEMSFLADRYQQLSDDLAQFDLFKTSVISDYYVFKSLIFSKVTLTNEEYALYRKIFNFMYKDLVKPDLYIYLYQNVNKLMENIKKRGRIYEQSIKKEYLEQIHDGYMNFIKTQKDLNILILDISNIDFVKQPEYYDKMLDAIYNYQPQEDNLKIIHIR